MILKDIKDYKFHNFDKELIINYASFLNEKKIKKSKKILLCNSFLATLFVIDCFLRSKKTKSYDFASFHDLKNSALRLPYSNSKYKRAKNLFERLLTPLVFIFEKFFNYKIKEVYGPGYLEKNKIKRITNFVKYKIIEKRLLQLDLINVEENKKKFLKTLKIKSKRAKFIIKIIPKYFFSEETSNIFKDNLKLIGSSDLVLDENFGKIISFKKKVNFINIIHGGGYYEYKDSYLEDFERKLAGKFPQIQKHVLREKSFIFKKRKKINLIFALRSPHITSDKFINSNLHEHLGNKSNYYNLKPFIKKFNIQIRPHPRGLNEVYEKEILNNKINMKINENDIFIFDTLSSSLIYWLLANNIPFIHVIKHLNWKKIQPQRKKYLNNSIKNGSFLYKKSIKEIDYFFKNIINEEGFFEKVLRSNKNFLKF